MIETLTLPADDATTQIFYATAAVRALTSARPINRFWGAATSDRIEIALGAERLTSIGDTEGPHAPQALHVDFHTPITIDLDLATQLRDYLSHWIALNKEAAEGAGGPDADS